MKPLRILHLEDDAAYSRLVQRLLETEKIECQIDNAATQEEFRSFLKSRPYDLVLADYALPGFDGLTALEIAKQVSPETPFIFLSGQMGEEIAIESLRNGATDYVLKPKGVRLPQAVMRAVRETETKRQQKKAERLIEEARAYAWCIVETVREPIILLDADWCVKIANRAFCKMFGLKKEQARGKRLFEMNQGEWDIPSLRQMLSSHDTHVQDFELESDFPGIGRRTFLLDAHWITGIEEGRPMILLAMEDVTDRKRAEEEVRRTMAVKSEFTAMVSHELRTPLTVIKEAVDIVLDGTDGPVNPDQEKHLGLAVKNVDRMTRLINNVLSYQKLESGGMEFRIFPQDLNAIVHDAVEGFMPVAQKTGLELQSEFEEKLPPILCDRDKIMEVIVNLLNNAVKFTDKGSIRVTTSLADAGARVSVEDTGVGIRQEDLSKLFQSFSQVPNHASRAGGGSGLGLAISKKIIECHKGQIAVSSRPGEGSAFLFTLPVYAGVAQLGRKILIADDEIDIMDLVVDRLTKEGYDVVVAQNGRDALALALECKPGLILLDYKMPQLDGHEVCRRLRADESLKSVPVIFMTASPQAATPEVLQEVGANDFLIKPFRAPELFQKIRSFL